MTHPTQLELSMVADGALGRYSRPEVFSHIDGCSQCAAQVDALKSEVHSIRQVMYAGVPVTARVPAFMPPVSLATLLRGLTVTVLLALLLVTVWQNLLSGVAVQVLNWFRPSHPSEGIGVFVNTVFLVTEEGDSMLNAFYSLAGYVLLTGLVAWLYLSKKKLRGTFSLVLCLVCVGSLAPEPAQALEIRKAEDAEGIVVDADEVIDDTLVVFADNAVIRGRIEGDLIAFGRRVSIDGEVTGNVAVFSQSMSVSGEIGGSVVVFSQSTSMSAANVVSNLWTFTNTLDMDDESNISGNATLFLNTATLSGDIGRDLTSYGDFIEVSGSVGEDVESRSRSLNLAGNASVGGNVIFHTYNEDMFSQSEAATVGGDVEFRAGPERPPRQNRYLTFSFYINQVVKIVAAFIAGLCLFTLFPAWRGTSLGSGMDSLKQAGLGFIALVSMPIAAIILAVTIIGIPIGVITLFAWIILFFFAKIMLGWVLGKRLLDWNGETSWAIPLVVGIAIIVVLVKLPMVGGLLNFCLTLIGAGILVSVVNSSLNLSKSG